MNTVLERLVNYFESRTDGELLCSDVAQFLKMELSAEREQHRQIASDAWDACMEYNLSSISYRPDGSKIPDKETYLSKYDKK